MYDNKLIIKLLKDIDALKTDISIADALEFRREQYQLSKTEFSFLLRITVSHYSEILSEKRRLPLGARKRAFAIGIPAETLLIND